ncbi:Enoyl-CoA hydratase/isomerase [Chondrus crispus]|uniref:Enoyl-CoA hydratase/isomerase n=1 Tax=Chondrus crispus TaxID=2769 RepID=R7QJD0_CHOCR|nr:Enoyl-CoA hydratase/isomerase [Chondrus crispus]CDF38209.1 Enoyl-CoA hydratase/isomerase [Chondrus crispus]|eukprot:XP_005718094.1 Enoyl-CoA hydratase/isomerase [Chondrus crispus]
MVAAASPLLLEESHGDGVVQLTLNRPAALNAFSEALYYATAAALRRHNDLASTRILVLTGAGTRTFCAGMDIKEVCSRAQAQLTVRAARAFMDALLECSKPVVAAVFGAVTGIGVTLLMHCDAVFAASDATFETPFSAIGIVPEFGSSLTFPLLLGLQLTSDLLMRGVRVGVGELERVGALKVVASQERDVVVRRAVDEALDWSRRNPSVEEWRGVLEAKRLVKEQVIKDTSQAIDKEMKAIYERVDDGTASKLMRKRVAELGRRTSKL